MNRNAEIWDLHLTVEPELYQSLSNLKVNSGKYVSHNSHLVNVNVHHNSQGILLQFSSAWNSLSMSDLVYLAMERLCFILGFLTAALSLENHQDGV